MVRRRRSVIEVKAKAGRSLKDIDDETWEAVKADYERGRTLEQIARKHKVGTRLTQAKAERERWIAATTIADVKIPGSKTRAGRERHLAVNAVADREPDAQAGDMSPGETAVAMELVQTNRAKLAARTIMEMLGQQHERIGRHREVGDRLLADLEAMVVHRDTLADMLSRDDGGKAAKAVLGLSANISDYLKLLLGMKELIAMERQVMGLRPTDTVDYDALNRPDQGDRLTMDRIKARMAEIEAQYDDTTT